MISFELDDAEARNRETPDTFWLPPLEERQSLSPGHIVKLIFKINHDGGTDVERMWVIVKAPAGSEYIGELDNQPDCTSELSPGAEIRFSARHIIDIRGPA